MTLLPQLNALGRVNSLRDPQTGETLHAYAPGNGEPLALVWSKHDTSHGRKVTDAEAAQLLNASQATGRLLDYRLDLGPVGPRYVRVNP